MKNTYQSALWTKEGYEAYINQYKEKVPLSVLLEIIPEVSVITSRSYSDEINIIGVKGWD